MITLEKASDKFAVVNVTRRSFLQGALSASAFVLCVGKVPLLAKAAGNTALVTLGSVPLIDATAFHPSVFLGIQPDGTVLIVAHRTEMGNGVRTSLPRIVADELDADWSREKSFRETVTSATALKTPTGLTRCGSFSTPCVRRELQQG